MDTIKIEKLKIAANQFYLNKYADHPTITDKEYDQLADEYKSEGGSVFELVDWDDDLKRPNNPLPKVDKMQVGDNKLLNAVNNWVKSRNIERYHLNYKYDGSSIIAYYTPEGRLHHILGTPDCNICVDRTKNCFNMFPHYVTPGIECIQGEFLVDASFYGQKARNKANGLLNSKDMIKDLECEGFIRVYQMRFYDGNWTYDRLVEELNKLDVIIKDRMRPVFSCDGHNAYGNFTDAIFAPAEVITNAENSIITEKSRSINGVTTSEIDFQVDGIVIYYGNPWSSHDNAFQAGGYYAFKFYYTESAITTITHVVWNKAGSGSWQPKLNFEPVVLNDKNISQAASGGYPNLSSSKMGKGAKVRVILSNMTIPKIIEVLEPSEDYEFPTCECGHALSPADLFGSGLKCTELDCSQRFKDRMNTFSWWFDMKMKENPGYQISDVIANDLFGVLNVSLNIDRWDSKSKIKDRSKTQEQLLSELKEWIDSNDVLTFKSWMESNFYLPGLCQSIFDINYLTAFKVLKEFINK